MTGAQRSRVGEASGYVGSLAARRPCAVIWGMIFWSLLMTMGLATMKVQTDGLYLWIPTQSSPYKNMLDMIDRFGPFRRNQILILYPKSGDNILTEENLKGVLDVHEDIAFNIVSDEKKVSFEDSAPPAPSVAPTRARFPRPRPRARAPRSLLRLRRGRLPPVQLLEPARALRLRPDDHRRGGERVDDQLHVHGPRGVGAAGGDFRRHPPRRERHAPGRGRHDHHLRDGRGEGDAVPRLGARLHRPHVRCAGRGDAARGLCVLRGPVHGRRGRAPRRDGHAPPLHGHVRHHGLPRLRVHALRQGLGRAEPHAPRALGLRRRRARLPRGLRDDGARRLRDQLHLLHGALHRPGRRLRRHARRPRVLRPARPRVRDGAFLRKPGRSPPAGRTSRIPSRNECARPCTTRARPSSSRA